MALSYEDFEAQIQIAKDGEKIEDRVDALTSIASSYAELLKANEDLTADNDAKQDRIVGLLSKLSDYFDMITSSDETKKALQDEAEASSITIDSLLS